MSVLRNNSCPMRRIQGQISYAGILLRSTRRMHGAPSNFGGSSPHKGVGALYVFRLFVINVILSPTGKMFWSWKMSIPPLKCMGPVNHPWPETRLALSFLRVSQRFSEETASCTLEISSRSEKSRDNNFLSCECYSSTHLFTITYLMGVALSSDSFLCDLIVNYIRHRFAG